ncbi:MAG: cell division protein ZapE [Rhodobacter sp.]|uniref:cell division protein ZapE n=1 Tax=Pararhodobacter sp. TaxID=2127056 RepID=UPI002B8CA8D1|nr:cell division protein ZapE [Pararhodobacter sp.]MCC0072578.1 cell division protein ZapE [Rhodobacter sp.]HPD94047.1 cell division protein ZapE [Pararhodobacter sp.]
MRQTLTELYDARVAKGEIRPDAAQRAVLPLLDERRAALETPQKKGLLGGLFKKPPQGPRGLYLWGGVGRGKSMLMDLFEQATDIDAKRRVHFHAFMQEIHHGMHEARKTGVDDALAPVARAVAQDLRLLAFDEMQITDITDAMIVGRLFQMLMEAGVVIVTTSNRPPEDLYKNGLNRALFLPFIALLRARMEVIELQSETDYRQHRLTGAQVYFTPADAGAHAAMDALWSELTGVGAGTPLVLEVQGRKVEIPHHHNAVARTGFWDLCGRPLGPADYLALADRVRVLMIEDIPHLSAANYNEAKRFVTLIDALYEGRVRLIASAADQPERLYMEGAGAFEFERTASRLREMQAIDWGSA